MTTLSSEAQDVVTSGRLAHLVTINPDGSPQVSIVWVGYEGDEIVAGHLGQGQKMRNIERDPRVALSMEAEGRNEMGLDHYLIVHGTARLTEGGGADLLQRLAHVYLGPDVKLPPFDNRPPGMVIRIAASRVGGVRPWPTTR